MYVVNLDDGICFWIFIVIVMVFMCDLWYLVDLMIKII